MTGPASGGTERGTRAPSRLTGTQGAVGAVLVVLALGLALRLIIAYLLPGSGFEVDLGAFRVLGVQPRPERPQRLLRPRLLPRLHARLPLRPVARRARRQCRRRCRRPDQDPADPGRPRRSATSPGRWSASSAAAIGWRWPPRPSPSSTRSPGSTASCGARPTRSASCSSCSGSASSGATAPNGPRSTRSSPRSSSPSSGILIPIVAVVMIRRALWPAGGFGDPERTGKPIRILDDGAGRVPDRGRDLAAVRPVGRRAQQPAAVPDVRPARAGRGRRRRLPLPDGQRLQPVGARAIGHRPEPGQRRLLGVRLRRHGPGLRRRHRRVRADPGRRDRDDPAAGRRSASSSSSSPAARTA